MDPKFNFRGVILLSGRKNVEAEKKKKGIAAARTAIAFFFLIERNMHQICAYLIHIIKITEYLQNAIVVLDVSRIKGTRPGFSPSLDKMW